MPSSKKPRKPKKAFKKTSVNASPAKKVMVALYPNRSRIDFQNKILGILALVENDETTVNDLDELYHYALTHEALCNAGYGTIYDDMYKDWDNALDAAFRRGDSGLRYGFNPREKEVIKIMLFEFIKALKNTPNDEFYAVENNMVDHHNKKILELRKVKNEHS
jgi:hypothetical protein